MYVTEVQVKTDWGLTDLLQQKSTTSTYFWWQSGISGRDITAEIPKVLQPWVLVCCSIQIQLQFFYILCIACCSLLPTSTCCIDVCYVDFDKSSY